MTNKPFRLLSIDPCPKGLGYSVFELPFRLVECGLSRYRRAKRVPAVVLFEKLLATFRPDALVIEDKDAPGSRRKPSGRQLLSMLASSARARGVVVHEIARLAVVSRFAPKGGHIMKQGIAAQLTRTFPELQSRLPDPRRLWEPEHERLAIFDALALAVTFAASQ